MRDKLIRKLLEGAAYMVVLVGGVIVYSWMKRREYAAQQKEGAYNDTP